MVTQSKDQVHVCGSGILFPNYRSVIMTEGKMPSFRQQASGPLAIGTNYQKKQPIGKVNLNARTIKYVLSLGQTVPIATFILKYDGKGIIF